MEDKCSTPEETNVHNEDSNTDDVSPEESTETFPEDVLSEVQPEQDEVVAEEDPVGPKDIHHGDSSFDAMDVLKNDFQDSDFDMDF